MWSVLNSSWIFEKDLEWLSRTSSDTNWNSSRWILNVGITKKGGWIGTLKTFSKIRVVGPYLKTFLKPEKVFHPLNKFFIIVRANKTVLAEMCLTHLLVNQITIQNITSKHNEEKSKRQKFIVVHPSLGLHPLSHHTTSDGVFFTIMQILYKQLQTTPFTPRKD